MITEIVLTGGPCSGKTTGLAILSRKLQERGFRTFVNPESPTMFLPGIPDIVEYAQTKPEEYMNIQSNFLLAHLDLRKRFVDMGSIFWKDRVVVLHDRGAMDGKAYMKDEMFDVILMENQLGLSHVRDSYNGVIHLVTAAIGAEEFYTTENNAVRRESPQEAADLDQVTMNCWIGHPYLRVVDNKERSFDEKMRRLTQIVYRLLGLPVPVEIERKYKVKSFDPDLIPGVKTKLNIEQIYLVAPEGEEIRIRKRSERDSATYYKTRKQGIGLSRPETEEIISSRDYVLSKAQQDPNTIVIRKKRTCFVYENQYFELDEFINPPGLVMMEIELTDENTKVDIPPFIEIEKEVTNDPDYYNKNIARKK